MIPFCVAPERLQRTEALFRIVQESAINIHRHAASATACLRLQADAEALVLEIGDRASRESIR